MPTPTPDEYSESGGPVYRHKERAKPFEPVVGESDTIEAVAAHVARHVGEPANVFHELVSDLVHVDVHVVDPTEQRPWYTLVTSGMSDRPMTVPDGADDYRFAELLICLPPDWPLTQEAFKDEANYWPIRWLKTLARMPHEYDTWLGAGHTIPTGDPPEPYAPDTKLCCMLLVSPVNFDDEFAQLKLPDGRVINFYSLIPLYESEMNFKLKHGGEALLMRFAEQNLSEVLDPKRPNVCKRKWWPF